jgi:hypothetical protein
MLTRALALGGIAVAAAMGLSGPAEASSDSTCYPEWKVKQTDYRGCSGMALLSPGNDTRINLLMLLYDRHGDVGVSNAISYNAMERRGEAQPFDYGVFALTLGRKPGENEGAGNGNYGNRCASNERGRLDFERALAAAKGLTGDEAAILANARLVMNPDCSDGSDMRALVAEAAASVRSATGKAFADYLRGVAAFYDGDYATARGFFQGLSKSSAAWPQEAAAYMIGRVALNAAMVNAFDDYGYPAENSSNSGELDAAERALKAYIAAYPNGSYAVSAQGLLRKVYWLGADNQKLLAEYVAAFKRAHTSRSNVSLADLVQEMDVKLGDKLELDGISDPQILAMLVLKAMRHSDDREVQGNEKPISRAVIEGLRSRFGGQEALYDYLLAAHALYVAKDPAAALQALPANPSSDGYLAYSQRALRALALDAMGDPGARAAMVAVLADSKKPFQRGTMELALAMHDERGKALERVFATDSPINDPEVREILLRYNAGPKLLRAQAASKMASKQEREVALYTLLYKNITRGAYKDFIADVALIPAGTKSRAADDYTSPTYTNIAVFKWAGQRDGFACPSLITLATALTAAPKDAPSLLCLGEFARLNGFDSGSSWPDLPGSLDTLPPKDQLGGTASLFPGKPFSRLEIYKSIIADPAAAPNSKAYALYRAVYCYGPSGYNSCGGTEVPIATRRGWFNQLKKNYPSSPWATKLKYYW